MFRNGGKPGSMSALAANTTIAPSPPEVVVTAQRFNSTIQNTPISLSAVTGDQLDAAGITSVEAFAREPVQLDASPADACLSRSSSNDRSSSSARLGDRQTTNCCHPPLRKSRNWHLAPESGQQAKN